MSLHISSSADIPITQAQFDAMHAYMEERALDDIDNTYGLLFQNCVDFIRDVLEVGGVDNDVSGLMDHPLLPVSIYAEITDWLDDAGFGPIMDAIGSVVGGIGEIGTYAINAAATAWSWAGDMAEAAFNFVSEIGEAVGGFVGGIARSIADFFAQFGQGDDEEEPIPEMPSHRSTGEAEDALFASDDDFILIQADLVADSTSYRDATYLDYEAPAQVALLLSSANDDGRVPEIAFIQPQEDYLFA